MSEGQAPGKVILLGEHAVVHGGWALALPWPAVEAVATATAAVGATQVVSEAGDYDVRGLTAAARAVRAEGCVVALRSSVPVGAGLGSSAATALAVVRAVAAFNGQACDELGCADVAERFAHGTPSGLDAATVAAAGPILFRRGDGARPVAGGALPALVVADTGRPRNAAEAVAAVAERLDRHRTLVDALGQAALPGAAALEAQDWDGLGQLMDEAQDRLATLGVSHPDLDRLVAVARAAGALGAKLTGAGRGGCVVALAPDAATARALASTLLDAGATRAWTMDGPV